MNKLFSRTLIAGATTAFVSLGCLRAGAIAIVSGPTFTPSTAAPLAGVMHVTTDVNSMVSVWVSNGTNVWQRDFYDYGTNHTETMLGFYPGQTNLMLVTVYDKYRNACTGPKLLTFVTGPLPSDFPVMTLLTNNPSQMEPGYTLFVAENRADARGYITIVDAWGQVVWYRQVLQSSDIDVQQQPDGNLFIHEQPPADDFVEMNLLGNIVQTWPAAAGYPVNSHVGIITDRGTILYLSDVSEVVTNFPLWSYPLSQSDSNNMPTSGSITVDDCPVVEVSMTNGALANVWSPLKQLGATRLTYNTGDFPDTTGLDTEHANAIIDDTNDNSIIVSLRNESTIYKFSRLTGKLIWILSPQGDFAAPAEWPADLQPYLLTPVGSPFEWCYAQHGPCLTPQGTLVVFDDGDYRACPFEPIVPNQDNYSRAVEYSIDETNMTISQVWDSYDSGLGGGDKLWSFILGNADWLPQRRNVLATFGWVNYDNGVDLTNNSTMARIVEYTHDPVPQVVFDLSVWNYQTPPHENTGYDVYRSHRITDFYGHPASPVADVVINLDGPPGADLQFSADPTHTYVVQASSDLINWTTIGTAAQDGDSGQFEFDDLNGSQFAKRFYRVITE
ncbi:MAG: aryl-sulfate sulfotransferase [Limisphaerales bacterium]